MRKSEEEYRQANAQNEQEYAETAATLAEKMELSADETAEVSELWRNLVKLFHPDRFAHEPEKQETYHKLTAAINQAKDNGEVTTLRRIAEDPHGFILRQGWASLDFGEEREIPQLRRLWESIELEIIRVLEAINQLKESPDYELHRLTIQTPAFFDEVCAGISRAWKRRWLRSKNKRMNWQRKSRNSLASRSRVSGDERTSLEWKHDRWLLW